MATPEQHIVSFTDPPVAEVGFSVQFSGPVIDPTPILGEFWPQLRADYPELQLHPPLPPLEEGFEVPTRPRIAFNIIGGPEASRYWFLNSDGTELVQAQPDRFGYNWRKESSPEPYPRYRHLRGRFELAFSTLLKTAQRLGKPAIPTWCEIAYTNPIILTQPGEPRPDLARIIRRIREHDLSVLPTPPTNTALTERFRVERDGGEPYAWFYLEVEPMFTQQDALGYRLTLQMRGKPPSQDPTGVLSFLDDGRSRIVQTFRDVTTPEMHERWNLA